MRHIPPPYAGPLMAAMIGCGIARIAGTTSLMYDIDFIARRENREVVAVRRDTAIVEVEARTEPAARPR